jgi:hypothetical protein
MLASTQDGNGNPGRAHEDDQMSFGATSRNVSDESHQQDQYDDPWHSSEAPQ